MVAAVAATVALAGIQSPASATGNATGSSSSTTQATVPFAPGNKLVVTQNAAGAISLPNGTKFTTAQVIHAEFNTAFPAGDLEIFQLHNGGTLTQVDTQIALAGQGGATASGAMHWFTGTWEDPQNATPAKTTFYGGRPFFGQNKFDLTLPAGTYIVTQLRPSGNVKPSTVYKTFTVVGTTSVQLPVVDGNVNVVNTNGPDLFSVNSITAGTDKLKNGWVRFGQRTGSITNRTRELHFFDFTPVAAGTTPAQACALVTANGPGNAASFGTMSTTRLVNGYLNVPLGWYWVTSWIPDTNTGTPHAIECEGKLVEVVAPNYTQYALVG